MDQIMVGKKYEMATLLIPSLVSTDNAGLRGSRLKLVLPGSLNLEMAGVRWQATQ